MLLVISSSGVPSRRDPGSKRRRWLGDRPDPYRASSNLAGRSKCVNRGSPEMGPPREADCGDIGSAEPLTCRRRPMSTSLRWNLWMSNSPGS